MGGRVRVISASKNNLDTCLFDQHNILILFGVEIMEHAPRRCMCQEPPRGMLLLNFVHATGPMKIEDF